MASPSPKTFLRFLAEQFDLVEGLCQYTTHSQGDVDELLERFCRGRALTAQDLVAGGILDFDEVHGRFAVVGHLKAFIDRLLARRHLVDSRLIEGAVQNLTLLREELDASVRVRSFTRLGDLVLNVRMQVDQLQDSVQGNLEAIRNATEAYRKEPPRSSRLRWARIRELWEDYVRPMQDLFLPDGPFDEASLHLRASLDHAEERAPLSLAEDLTWARYYLRKLGTQAFRAYQEAAREVQPLYEQAKRNARVALAASTLVAAYRRQALGQGRGVQDADWDRWFGLMDPWDEARWRKPFGTAIATWLAQAWYRRREAPDEGLAQPPGGHFRVPLSDKVVAHHFRARGGSAEDLMPWLLQEFPEASLREVLRAYHHLLKTTEVARTREQRVLRHPEGDIQGCRIGGTVHGTA